MPISAAISLTLLRLALQEHIRSISVEGSASAEQDIGVKLGNFPD